MHVVTLTHGWYPDDINSKLNFEEFGDGDLREVLFVGIPATEEPAVVAALPKVPRRVYVNLEHPCTLYGEPNRLGLDPVQQQTIFNEIYTICPYTADWFNGLNLGTKMVAAP